MSNETENNNAEQPAEEAKMITRPKRVMHARAKPKARARAKPRLKAKDKARAKAEHNGHQRTDQFGFRLGTKKAKAARLFARGATLAEVKKACQGPQFNLLTQAEKNGFRVKREVIANKQGRQITRYHLVA